MPTEPTVIPADIGLPPKFTAFRKGQLDAVMALSLSDRRITLMSAPTGVGKSIIVMSLAQLTTGRTLVLTGTKGLQGQYSGDFATIGLKDIRGKNNYRCVGFDIDQPFFGWERPGTPCNEGPCNDGEECELKKWGGCLYYDAVARARGAKLVITNYRYWMTLNRYSDPDSIGAFDLIILDEAHSAPDELADFCTISIERSDVKELLDMDLPPLDDDQDVWMDWATMAHTRCQFVWVETRGSSMDRRAKRRLLRRLVVMGQGLSELSRGNRLRRAEPSDPGVQLAGSRTDWVAEKTGTGMTFSPVWAHAYAEDYLFRKIPRVVLVSATLQPAVGRYLGINPDESEFKEFASTFDARRRPLTHLPTTTVDRNSTEGQLRVWVNKIDAVIDGRLGRKGIIHTRSYDRAQMILARSKHRQIMLGHTSRSTRDVVEAFKRSKGPRILVSPAVEEGYDFPYDECRYQIIAKVPFVDSRSAIIKARAKSDKLYLNYLTALSLIQMVGRGMRAEDDWCETFIVDDNIGWFWPAAKSKGLFPQWFVRAYHRGAGVPPALNLSGR